jgi:outer membrane immunogenic protein
VTGAQVLTTSTASKSLDYLGAVLACVGYLVTPTLLVYGTGGLAYGGINLNTNIGQFAITPAFAAAIRPHRRAPVGRRAKVLSGCSS